MQQYSRYIYRFLSDHKTSPFINIFNTKVEEQDLDSFTKNIFKMFDVNNDRVLTFEEFTFATSAQNYDDPKEKLYWLFDNVYDKVCVISKNTHCSLYDICNMCFSKIYNIFIYIELHWQNKQARNERHSKESTHHGRISRR